MAAGEYAAAKLDGKAMVMNVGLPFLSATVLRSMDFMDGLKTIIPDATMVHALDGGGNPDRSLEVSAAALAQNGDINIISGINDSSELGGLHAWKACGRSQDGPLVVGPNGEDLGFINSMSTEPAWRIEAANLPHFAPHGPERNAVCPSPVLSSRTAVLSGTRLAMVKAVLLGLLVLLCVGFSFGSEQFYSFENLIATVPQCALVLIVASGMTLLLIAAEVDLSAGAALPLSGVSRWMLPIRPAAWPPRQNRASLSLRPWRSNLLSV